MAIVLVTFWLEAVMCSLFAPYYEVDSVCVAASVIGIHTIATVIGIAAGRRRNVIRVFMLLGFCLRLFLLFFDVYGRDIFLLPSSGMDTERFARQAAELYLTGIDQSKGFLYVKMVAFFYRFFGVNRLIAQYVNLILGMCVIFVAEEIMNELQVSLRAKTYALLLICLLPYPAIMQILLLRESVIMFLLSLSLLFFLRWVRLAHNTHLLLSMVFAVLATLFHSGSIGILVAEMLIFALYDRRSERFVLRSESLAAMLLAAAFFGVIYLQWGNLLFRKFKDIDSASAIIEKAEFNNRGAAAYTAGFSIANPVLNLIINTPIRMLYFLGSPVPWGWRGLLDVIGFVFSTLPYGVIYCRAFAKLKNKAQSTYKPHVIMLLLILLVSSVAFAWGVSNSGVALRHRDKMIIFYIILLAVCESETSHPLPELTWGGL